MKKKNSKTLDIAKDNSKFLITIGTCVVLLMVMFYVGTSASKKTYSEPIDGSGCMIGADGECANSQDSSSSPSSHSSSKPSSSSSSISCAAGEFLPANSTTCEECPARSYCVGGSYSPGTTDNGITSCSTDYPLSDTGSKHSYDCYKNISVATGKYYDIGVLKDCPVGAYCSGGQVEDHASGGAKPNGIIKYCDPGKTTDSVGSTSASDCHDCSNKANVKSWITGCIIQECNTGYVKKGDYCVAEGEEGRVDKPTCSDKTYNGAQQALVSRNNGYTVTYNDSSSSPINVGTYTIVVSLVDGYKWSDNSTSPITLSCKINKYVPTVNVLDGSMNVGTSTNTIYVNTIGNCAGILTVSSSDNSKLEITSGSSTTIDVSSGTETQVDSSTIGLNGKTAGNYTLTGNFVPSNSNNCKSVRNTGSITVKDDSNSTCSVNITMPNQVDLGAEFEASATITDKGSSSNYSLKSGESINWSCGGSAYAGKETILTNYKYRMKTYSYQGAYNVTCSVSVKNGNTTNCSASATTRVGDSIYDTGKNTFTFKNGNEVVATKTCTVNSKGLCEETGTNVITTPNPPTRSGYYFYGWGSTVDCKSGGYGSNIEILGTNVSAIYYACFDTKAPGEEADADFDKTKCSYIDPIDVVYDTRYLNCKRTNISYKDRASRTRGNVKACCLAKGYTWVGENFDSAIGGEYCIICSGGSHTTCDDTTNGKYSTEVKAREDAAKTCATGATINVSKESNGCYKYSCSAVPSNSTNIIVNPPTGNALIMVVWAIGALMIGYTVWYFMNRKDNN